MGAGRGPSPLPLPPASPVPISPLGTPPARRKAALTAAALASPPCACHPERGALTEHWCCNNFLVCPLCRCRPQQQQTWATTPSGTLTRRSTARAPASGERRRQPGGGAGGRCAWPVGGLWFGTVSCSDGGEATDDGLGPGVDGSCSMAIRHVAQRATRVQLWACSHVCPAHAVSPPMAVPRPRP